jgi:RNA polymerase sigma factor (sigma-70 family)
MTTFDIDGSAPAPLSAAEHVPQRCAPAISAPAPNGDRSTRLRTTDHGAVAEWVLAAASGDHRSWDRLVDAFASTVWAIARAQGLNAADAADVSQTTWLRLYEHLDRIEHPERVGAWLATTARREALRLIRLGARHVSAGDELDAVPDQSSPPSPEHNVAVKHREKLMAELVTQLPARSQALLRLLSADSPLSYRDISQVLDMPIGSIGPTRSRALDQLRRLALRAGLTPEDIVT